MNDHGPSNHRQDEIEDDTDRHLREFFDWIRSKDPKVSDWILAFTSVVLTFVGISQLVVSCSSAEQTDKLITAAGRNADAAERNSAAAESFAMSAQTIKESMGSAVINLGIQATNIETARKSSIEQSTKVLNATINNSQSEARAYIVMEPGINAQEDCQVPGQMYASMCGHFNYANIGKTPAINVQYEARLRFDTPAGGLGVGAQEDLKNMANTLYLASSGISIGDTHPIAGEATAQNRRSDCRDGYHLMECGYTIYGIIHYQDIFQKAHETGFCIHYPSTAQVKRFCDQANWVDVRPEGYPLKTYLIPSN